MTAAAKLGMTVGARNVATLCGDLTAGEVKQLGVHCAELTCAVQTISAVEFFSMLTRDQSEFTRKPQCYYLCLGA